MSLAEIRILRIGVPGPPGEGITEAELAVLQADIADLFSGNYRGLPLIVGEEIIAPFDAQSVDGAYISGFAPNITGISETKWHRYIARGRVRVTTVGDTILTVKAALAGIGFGPLRMTPTSAGTYALKFYGAWDVAPGGTSRSAAVHIQTSEATDVTFHEVELELMAIPQTL